MTWITNQWLLRVLALTLCLVAGILMGSRMPSVAPDRSADHPLSKPAVSSAIPFSEWPSQVYNDLLPQALDILGKERLKHMQSEFKAQFSGFPVREIRPEESPWYPGLDMSKYDHLVVTLRTEYFMGAMPPLKQSVRDSLTSVNIRDWRMVPRNTYLLAPVQEDVAAGVRCWRLVAAFGKDNHLMQWWYVSAR